MVMIFVRLAHSLRSFSIFPKSRELVFWSNTAHDYALQWGAGLSIKILACRISLAGMSFSSSWKGMVGSNTFSFFDGLSLSSSNWVMSKSIKIKMILTFTCSSLASLRIPILSCLLVDGRICIFSIFFFASWFRSGLRIVYYFICVNIFHTHQRKESSVLRRKFLIRTFIFGKSVINSTFAQVVLLEQWILPAQILSQILMQLFFINFISFGFIIQLLNIL